jgi:hypothetical protein
MEWKRKLIQSYGVQIVQYRSTRDYTIHHPVHLDRRRCLVARPGPRPLAARKRKRKKLFTHVYLHSRGGRGKRNYVVLELEIGCLSERREEIEVIETE